MYPDPIQKFIEKFSKLPSVGPRQAARFAFFLLKQGKPEIEECAKLLSDLAKNIKICPQCFYAALNGEDGELCSICKDKTRNQTVICVVEKETDLISLEKTKKYNGLYYVLGGQISPLEPESYKQIKIKELIERVKNSKIKEAILATNPTTEGDLTARYLEKILRPFDLKITRLGRGLPTGGDIEFADQDTLGNALEQRKETK
ncbi:MAG: recombination mediator RecR [bacterium]|nr:recombination mediator RecR [bacterium]